MAARIALVLSAAFLCLVLGLVSAPAIPAVVAPAHPLRLADLRLEPAGVESASAATALAGGAAPSSPGPAQPARTPAPRIYAVAALPPPPPPPGPEVVLRSSVAAVTEAGGRLNLVLAGGGRRLGEGDAFMGWTLASVSRTGAVLRKGAARRDVSFFAPSSSSLLGSSPSTANLGGAASYGAASPTPLQAPRPVAPQPRAPTAAEYFRGFKG